jgi:L-alanine-DL-glutamate epimerase-like enolase superfamily enzyme
MRIERLTAYDATPASAVACSWSRRAPDAFPCDVLVEVEVALGGRSAWGCGGVTRYPERRDHPSDAALRDLEELVGVDLARGEPRLGVSYEPTRESLVAAAQLAMVDALARDLDAPAAALLGGVKRVRVPAYASTLAYETVEEFLACLESALAQAFRIVKFHANGDPDLDCEVIRASREVAGADATLLWDGEYAYEPHEALQVGRALDNARYAWFEAPVRDDASPALAQLSARLETPLVPGARRPRHGASWAREVLAGTWGALRTNMTRMPTAMEALRVIRLAESLDVPCELESLGYPLTALANLHAMAATESCRFFEAPFPLDLLEGVGAAPRVEDGYVSLPAAPGLGHGLTPEEIRGSCELLVDFGS